MRAVAALERCHEQDETMQLCCWQQEHALWSFARAADFGGKECHGGRDELRGGLVVNANGLCLVRDQIHGSACWCGTGLQTHR